MSKSIKGSDSSIGGREGEISLVDGSKAGSVFCVPEVDGSNSSAAVNRNPGRRVFRELVAGENAVYDGAGSSGEREMLNLFLKRFSRAECRSIHPKAGHEVS